jgi:thioester reductase-like protein
MRPRFNHVVDALEYRGAKTPDAVAHIFLSDGENTEQALSFGSLLAQARAVSESITDLTSPGDRVIIMLPPGIDFFPLFWGCLYAGTVPCVVYPPARFSSGDLAPVIAMSKDAEASLLITSADLQRRLLDVPPDDDSTSTLPGSYAFLGLASSPGPGRRRDTETAYLQYTSGSTSSPKGVRISHRGLADHLENVSARFEFSPEATGVWWLPVHHSFGLIAGVLLPAYAGSRAVSMSPAHFLERPVRWLEAIDRYRATHSGGPNFAYDLVSTRLAAGDAKRALDLSCWRLAGCGGEAVQPGTLERVQNELAKVGMAPTTLVPSYGLSEATLTVSVSPFQKPTVICVDGEALQRGEIVHCDRDAASARSMVGVGKLLSGFEMKLVDPGTSTVTPSDKIGEVWLRGAAVAQGYWRRPEESRAVFEGRIAGADEVYLRTGDLGFLSNDELFITGRCKELIIVRGLNYYPADLEATVRGADPSLSNTPVAAFPWTGANGEHLGIAVELDSPDTQVANRIRACLASEHGIECELLAIVPRLSLPRTASGKLQRLQISRLAQAGSLGGVQTQPTRSDAKKHAAQWGLPAVKEMLADLSVPVDERLNGASRLGDLALSSLTIARFTAEAQLRYGKRVSLDLMLSEGATVDDVLSSAHVPTPASEYQRDVYLPVGFASLLQASGAATSSSTRARAARDVLLTGATGYLGANILLQLLRDPANPTIRCLVRAPNAAAGLVKLKERFQVMTGGELGAPANLEVVCGDVAEERLGLSHEAYDLLARAVDTVVHSAAQVNFVFPYSWLRKANVVGTQTVLQFCATHSLKRLHFLSTIGVLATGKVNGPARPESEAVEPDADLLVGYEQSKWVADRIVHLAREAGLPAWIYRVGFVGGRSDDGSLLRSSEFFPSFLRGCAELGIYPSMDSPCGAVSVDWVAEVISKQALKNFGEPVDLHLVHPAPLTVDACFERLRNQGYAIQPVTFHEWKRRLFSTTSDELRRNALYDYLAFLDPLQAEHMQLPAIEFSASQSMWAQYPCRDATYLFDTCIQRLQESGELAPPPQ